MDINGGQLTQTGGNPVWPTTGFTGPLIAGNVFHSDGTGTLAGAGEQVGTANQGYAEMIQSSYVLQPVNGASSLVFTTNIVIPAQSMITGIFMFVQTAWNTTTTMGFGWTGNATALTTAAAFSGATLGQIAANPGTSTTQINNWINVGNTDVQLIVTSGGASSGANNNGVGVLYVRYMQGVNQLLNQ